ncbi:hypothetical protein BPUTEOMOX_1418 [methanotrophic endosymbiont of Bathymodiolus puteoserpentis (Logatchev)]|nr:hypothetical protein BPUTEOMOX_1418 [methanotrophic endosymbiont of Bathymodiolus puteoserpentis (Logatchev)]
MEDLAICMAASFDFCWALLNNWMALLSGEMFINDLHLD